MTPTAVPILVPQADLLARPLIAPSLEPSRRNRPLTGTTRQYTSTTVWIVQLKGVCGSELKGSSGRIILRPTCGTSTVFLKQGSHQSPGIKSPSTGTIHASVDGVILCLYLTALSFSYNLCYFPLSLSYFLSAVPSIPPPYLLDCCMPSNRFVISYHVASSICFTRSTPSLRSFFLFFFCHSLPPLSSEFTQIT